MEYKYIIFPLLFSISLFSCNNKNIDESQKIISIDINENNKIDINEFISKIEIIPLENSSECIISPYFNLKIYNDTIFIYDNKQLSMFSFNIEGKFINKSNSLFGPGPEEINYIEDVLINPFTNDIEFLSPFGTILIADKNFKYKKKIKYPRENKIINYFSPITKDLYILVSGNTKEYLIYSKSKNKIIYKFTPKYPIIFQAENGGQPKFHHYNDTLYYIPNYFHNTTYKITEKGISSSWKVDFGEFKNIPEEDNSAKFHPYFTNHPEKVFPVRKHEINNGFITMLSHNNKLFLSTSSKKTKKTKVFENKFKDGSQILPYHNIDNKHIYYLTHPTYLSIILNKDNKLITNYKETIEHATEDDNYVLIKYTINEDFWDN